MRIAATPRSGAGATPTPRYVRRSRKKGFRTPEGVIYCGRPTVRGNPFDWRIHGIARAVRLYADWFDYRLSALALERMGFCPAEIDALTRKRERLRQQEAWLRGKELSCWCAENARFCHVRTVLLPRLNAPETPS
ncbi:MAG TPA: DUF4326 domain-containing protein [Allosphingosinicella sp.]|jgi:hypothetical protein|nr:DUF4326 domain-containing protein [Allosphingosinicella sp.]